MTGEACPTAIPVPFPRQTSFGRNLRSPTKLSAGLGTGLWICDQLSTQQGHTLELANPPGLFKATLYLPK